MSIKPNAALLAIVSLLGIVLALPMSGQVQNASLTGLVSDPSGAPVPETAVTARNSATNVTRVTTTDSSGYYVFPELPVGSYVVTVKKDGFKQVERHDVVLQVGQRARIDFPLEVGAITQVVEVTGATPLLQVGSASPGSLVTNRMVIDLPLSSRNYNDLLITVAGSVGDRFTTQGGGTTRGRVGGVNVHGLRQFQNNFILDGVDNNTVSHNVLEQSTQSAVESVDAIQEFKMTTTPYDPQYGRAPGATVVISTKSGTNKYHGTFWEFLRNDKLDAADFFANRAGAKKGILRQNQFGANVGGPILRDRAFFFFNWESLRQVVGVARLSNVPLPNERIGDFSDAAAAANRVKYAPIFDRVGDCRAKVPDAFDPNDPLGANHFKNNIIPAACLDPVAQRITGLIPAANAIPGAGAKNANNYFRNAGSFDRRDSFVTRGDAEINTSNHVFARYFYSRRSRFIPGAFGGIIDGSTSGVVGRQYFNTHSVALGWDHIFGQRMLNEFRMGYSRDDSLSQQDPFGLNTLAEFGIMGVNESPVFSGGLPGIVVESLGGVPRPGGTRGEFNRLGSPEFLPSFNKTQQFQFNDVMHISHGTHDLQLGAALSLPIRDILLNLPALRGSLTFRGQFTGIGFADFLLGLPQAAQLTNLAVVDQRLWGMGGFFGDSWKVTPKFTLSYGLRYDFFSYPKEGRDRMTNLNPQTGKTFGVADSNFGRSLVQSDKNNLGPRISFAYNFMPKTVLRAGYGRFYQLFERIGSEDQLAFNLPFVVNNVVSTSSRTIPVENMRLQTGFNLSLDPSSVDRTKVRVRAVNPNARQPVFDQWSLGLQQEVPGDMAFTLEYVGTNGTHLSVLENLNQQLFNPDGTPTGIIPFPSLGPIEFRENGAKSHYHGLEATLEGRNTHGLTFRAAYTYSHSIDWVRDTLSFGGSSNFVQNTRDVRGTSRGSSDFDVRHNFALTAVYDVPVIHASRNSSGFGRALYHVFRDWSAGSIFTARTGRPVTISASANDGLLGDRGGLISALADCLGDAKLDPKDRTVSRYFDTSQFRVPANPVRLGNCGRNTVRAPGLVQMDFNISRRFMYFGEGRKLEFRWEILNAFNTPHFGSPSGNASSNAFGQISDLSGDPRVMQGALKFYF
ncbi:MAG: TonB-dependent receptor [Acidobacteriota bacterium]